MAREDFSATPVCNEWWLPSGRGLGTLGANLLVEDQFSALISVANAPDKDGPTVEQTRVFEAALRHIIRAVRISRQFWALDLGPATAPDHLENLPQAIFLAGASARVVFANGAAKAMLDAGDGMLLRDGRLATADGSDALANLITSCARTSPALGGPRRRTRGPARSPPAAPPGDGDTASIQSPAGGCSLDRRGGFRRRCHGERPRVRPAAARDKSAPAFRPDRRGDGARRRDFEWQWPQGSGAAARHLRLKPNSPAYSRRPEPNGRPSSSVSCSMPPKRKRWNGETTSASGFRSAPSSCPILPVLDAAMFEARFRPNQALRRCSVRRFLLDEGSFGCRLGNNFCGGSRRVVASQRRS